VSTPAAWVTSSRPAATRQEWTSMFSAPRTHSQNQPPADAAFAWCPSVTFLGALLSIAVPCAGNFLPATLLRTLPPVLSNCFIPRIPLRRHRSINTISHPKNTRNLGGTPHPPAKTRFRIYARCTPSVCTTDVQSANTNSIVRVDGSVYDKREASTFRRYPRSRARRW